MQDGRGPCWFYTGEGCLATTGLDKTSLVLVNEAGLIHSLFVVSQAILFPTVRECIKRAQKNNSYKLDYAQSGNLFIYFRLTFL